MKARIEKLGISVIPETKAEIDELVRIWDCQQIYFEKSGCIIHGGTTTKHSIDNSLFFIKFIGKIGK